MGVLNTTPDSFYDGGMHVLHHAACQRVDELLQQGADIIDIGAESTRPGSSPVSAETQLERLGPVVKHAVSRGALVSVDTSDARVAEVTLDLGARIINDVSCLKSPELARVVAPRGAILVLMHSRGPMSGMQGFSRYPEDGYGDVVADVRREWQAARSRAVEAGVAAANIFFDPGLGFNKSARHSLTLLARLDEFLSEQAPIVIGPSRKSFIAEVDAAPPADRLGGTIAACVWAAQRGASIFRVHDVQPVKQALALLPRLEQLTHPAFRVEAGVTDPISQGDRDV